MKLIIDEGKHLFNGQKHICHYGAFWYTTWYTHSIDNKYRPIFLNSKMGSEWNVWLTTGNQEMFIWVMHTADITYLCKIDPI